MLEFNKYNLVDWLSFYRVAITPFLLLLIFFDLRLLFAWGLTLSYTTDALDGYLARKLNITSSRGAQLDSLGDQLTFVIGVIGLFFFEFNFMLDNLWLILLALTPYVAQVLIAFKKYGKTTAFHTYLAKLSAITQAVFILWLLFSGPVYWLFYFMIIIGIIETLEEIILIFLFDNWVSDVKGLYWGLRDKRRHDLNDTSENKKP